MDLNALANELKAKAEKTEEKGELIGKLTRMVTKVETIVSTGGSRIFFQRADGKQQEVYAAADRKSRLPEVGEMAVFHQYKHPEGVRVTYAHVASFLNEEQAAGM